MWNDTEVDRKKFTPHPFILGTAGVAHKTDHIKLGYLNFEPGRFSTTVLGPIGDPGSDTNKLPRFQKIKYPRNV